MMVHSWPLDNVLSLPQLICYICLNIPIYCCRQPPWSPTGRDPEGSEHGAGEAGVDGPSGQQPAGDGVPGRHMAEGQQGRTCQGMAEAKTWRDMINKCLFVGLFQ